MARAISRRALLFGRTAPGPDPSLDSDPDSKVGPQPDPLRPPWALAPAAFLSACTGCGACVAACPPRVLTMAQGTPRFDPMAGECTFCHACADACEPRALQYHDDAPPWPYRARVDAACLSAQGVVCASCLDACPERAIRIPLAVRTAAWIDPAVCSGCGACVAICPVGAIALAAPEREYA